MWKNLIISIIASLLLAGCTTHDQIMLSKLKESSWYKSQEVWASGKNDADMRLNKGYIFAGRIKEVRYDYYQKTISEVILSPAYCLYAPSYWTEWFSPDPVNLSAANDDFKDFPTVGEYWAFGAAKDPKDRYAVKSVIKLYDTDPGPEK